MQALTDCCLFGITYDNFKKLQIVMSRFKEITGAINRGVLMNLLMQRDFLQHGFPKARQNPSWKHIIFRQVRW